MTVDLPVEKPMTLARERFERIYKTIRDRICLLEYEPGARLGEEELAREFGVSRTPLRRVLSRLEGEGLLESRHGVGTFVTDVDLDGDDKRGILLLEQLLAAADPPAVIMLSTLASDIDRIIGLEIGADDYLAKPCNPRELLARVRSVLRRHALPPAGGDGTFPGRLLLFGGWQLDQQAWTLTDPAGEPVDLSSSEIRLLAALANAHGAVLTRDQLIDAIHGDEGMVFDRAIDIHISRLRRKLAERGGADLIRTVRGAGYSLPAATERR